MFSPDGKTLASAGADYFIRLWDVGTGKELRAFKEPRIEKIAYSPDGKMIASAGFAKVVKVWDAATGKEIRSFGGDEFWATSVAFSPDSKTLALASTEKVQVLNITSGKLIRSLDNLLLTSFVSYSRDGKLLATVSRDTVRLWDIATGKVLRVLQPPNQELIGAIVFSPDAKTSGFGRSQRQGSALGRGYRKGNRFVPGKSRLGLQLGLFTGRQDAGVRW